MNKEGPKKLARTVESEYANALSTKNLDSSEYIVLSMGYLQNKAGTDAGALDTLKQIRENHANGNYVDAKKLIIKILTDHPTVADPEMADLIRKRAATLKDNPDENHNRRFIETRLAALLEKNLSDSKNFSSVAKLVPIMEKMGIGPLLQRNRIPPLKTTGKSLAEARENILLICMLNDNIEMGLKGAVEDYKNKDRFEKSTDPKDKRVASRNLGIMKAITPNFYDLITERDTQSRIADRFKVDSSKAKGFSATNESVPFINSISGTTFTLSALLTEYMKAHKGEPELQTDVNNIIQTFMAVYVTQGFHSLGEMTLVLNHPNIQKIFAENNVKLNLGFPPAVLNLAYQEAELYTKVTCNKRAMQDQLKIGPQTPPIATTVAPAVPAATTKSSAIPTQKELGVDVGKVVTFNSPAQAGRTYMEFASEELKQKAFEALIKQFGDKSVRIAGRAKTIEFLTDNVKEYMKIPLTAATTATVSVVPPVTTKPAELPPTLEALAPTTRPKAIVPGLGSASASAAPLISVSPDALLNDALKKGTPTKFQGKAGDYIVFKDQKEMDAAVKSIQAKFGEKACRVAGNPKTIEIYADVQKHLTTERLFDVQPTKDSPKLGK
jgi:hypothetical protein